MAKRAGNTPPASTKAVDQNAFRGNVRAMANALPISKIEEYLSNGPYAWPGGYPLYFLASDGEALSFKAVKDNLDEIRDSHARNDRTGGWLLIGVDTNWEDGNLTCSHTGDFIESAYGEAA